MDYIPRDTIDSFQTLMLKGKNLELKESYKRNQKSSVKLTDLACPEAWPEKSGRKKEKSTDRTDALKEGKKDNDKSKNADKKKKSNGRNSDPKKGQKDKNSTSNKDQKNKSDQTQAGNSCSQQSSSKKKSGASPSRKDPDKCFKCQEPGHFFRDCENEGPDIFCYSCGKPDVTAHTCPTCKDKTQNKTSENSKRGQQ